MMAALFGLEAISMLPYSFAANEMDRETLDT